MSKEVQKVLASFQIGILIEPSGVYMIAQLKTIPLPKLACEQISLFIVLSSDTCHTCMGSVRKCNETARQRAYFTCC